MRRSLRLLTCFLELTVGSGCALYSRAPEVDPLPSWRETAAKRRIVAFVERVTDDSSKDFVAPRDRIATFDNDGTLWSEKPLYFQLSFAIDRLRSLAPSHPEWSSDEVLQAAIEGDLAAVVASGSAGLAKLLLVTHGDMTTAEFHRAVAAWIGRAKHPRFDRPFTDLVYQPMLELLQYLRDNEFKVFICSGGGSEFMRVWVEEVYGIPRERIIGSVIETRLRESDGKLALARQSKFAVLNDKHVKPVSIQRHVGRRPVAAFGNSDGDLQMLQWSADGQGPSLQLLVHHTDGDREWAYDRSSKIGRLDKALDEAGSLDWVVVDMKRDWNVIFPFER